MNVHNKNIILFLICKLITCLIIWNVAKDKFNDK